MTEKTKKTKFEYLRELKLEAISDKKYDVVEIPLDQVNLELSLVNEVREKSLDQDRVACLRRVRESGKRIGVIVIAEVEGETLIVDGRHAFTCDTSMGATHADVIRVKVKDNAEYLALAASMNSNGPKDESDKFKERMVVELVHKGYCKGNATEIAKRVNLDRRRVSRIIRADSIQTEMIENECWRDGLKISVLDALAQISNPEVRKVACRHVYEDKLRFKDLRELNSDIAKMSEKEAIDRLNSAAEQGSHERSVASVESSATRQISALSNTITNEPTLPTLKRYFRENEDAQQSLTQLHTALGQICQEVCA